MAHDLVPHPRYENPEPGCEVTVEGDITKQHATDVVYAYYDIYTDQLLTCRKCERKFYFFAKEQKYWYEELGFWVDARCVHCFECRLTMHKVKRLQKEYERLQKLKAPTQSEVKRFRVVAKTLIKIGCMKDKRKIDKLG
ncbi:zinc-ribbon domain containing protein [Motilimonas eburnea]|uniref:zinc-ribbon domain containing protein n=1 Tax=Motilimonas eburnea TaxID=1737488 RepID=UPI001E47780B|nr:zinc-ribbon domain containing protein [Motilimonas eburnea]MCE2571891.1 zinc-ribbon domain-containing protein [Motilimonas eburnea]